MKLSSFFCAAALTITLISADFSQATDEGKTIHQFQIDNGGTSVGGYYPKGGLIADSLGNLYGVASAGGLYPPEGTIFELSPNGSGGWTYNVIYNCSDTGYCAQPIGSLVMDAAGNLYGSDGGFQQVFEISPDGSGSWTASLVYTFSGTYDGNAPGAVILDGQGNLYGANQDGGNGYGFIFELSPASGGGWTLTHLHDFVGTDGSQPFQGLILDASGNLYGTTPSGGTSTECTGGCGVAFELTNTNGAWTETVLHNFENKEGSAPLAPLFMDSKGDLYGTASAGGPLNYGTVFKLSQEDGTWVLSGIHSFTCENGDGTTPNTAVIEDAEGNLYGNTSSGGSNSCFDGEPNGYGAVYELSTKGGHWRETILDDFNGGSDGVGGEPLLLGSGNNLFAVATANDLGGGIVYELTPPPGSAK
jgi:uncharacterized repeat protein (TIGR03803 family)